MAKRVVGVYHSEQEVRDAVEELKNEGHRAEDISLVANDSEETSWVRSQTDVNTESTGSTEGTADEEPNFWEKVKAAFTGEDTEQQNTGGYKDKFTDLGLTDDQATEYESDVQQGRVVVLAPETPAGTAGTGSSFTGDLSDNKGERNIKDAPPNVEGTNRAGDPLKDEDESSADRTIHDTPPNVEGTDRAGDPLKDENKTSASFSADTGSSAGEKDEERKIRLRKEELEIDKEEVQSGEVEVQKEVHEETKKVDVPVTREEVYVERNPVNDQDTKDAGGKMEDETINVPLKEEKVDVKKKPVVTDEVKVGKKKVEETEEVSETVKREDINVDRDSENKRKTENDESPFKKDDDKI